MDDAGRSSRIPLQRKFVPHSYTRRRLQNGTTSTVASLQRVSLTGYVGAVYYADVDVGASVYRLIVDTGSTDTWVSCVVFDPARCVRVCPSSALSISYGSGSVCVATEILPIRVGNLIIKNYGVGVGISPNARSEAEASGGILLGPSQGILGLGYRALATVRSVPGYVVEFLQSFSVFLAPKDNQYGSFLLLNGVDTELISQNQLVPYSLPLKRPTHWTLGLTGFHIAGHPELIQPCSPSNDTSCDAIIDTGTTLIVIPHQVFDVFVSTHLLPATCYMSTMPDSYGMYVCPRAATLPALQFTFNETNFYLEMEDYIQRAGSIFYVEIQPSGKMTTLEQTYVLGGTFLKRFYSSYEVSKAVVFYCNEGTSCDRNGTASLMLGNSSFVSATASNDTSANEASESVIDLTSAPVVDPTAGSKSSSITYQPGDVSPNNGTSSTTIGSSSSSSSSSSSVAITVIACVAGLAFVIAVVFVVRRLYRKRQNRPQENRPADQAMETVAPADVVESPYLVGDGLTPTGTSSRR